MTGVQTCALPISRGRFYYVVALHKPSRLFNLPSCSACRSRPEEMPAGLSIWYDLSDVKLAEALNDRGSFRRFCGFSGSEPTPERTAFVRFRKALVARGLDKTLFDEITGHVAACTLVLMHKCREDRRRNIPRCYGNDTCRLLEIFVPRCDQSVVEHYRRR